MSIRKGTIFLVISLLLSTSSCKKPSSTVTSQPVPFTPISPYAKGIEKPMNSWFYQIPTEAEAKGSLIPIQSDLEGNVYFIGRDQLFYSLNTKGALRWKKEGGFQPVLDLLDEKTLLTYRNDIKLYSMDGSVKSIWMETGTGYQGPDGYVYTVLPSLEKKIFTFCSLDSQGDLRWKAPYQLKYGGTTHLDGVWYDQENNIYFLVEDISEDQKFSDTILFSFRSDGTPRWRKNFPNHFISGFPFNQIFQSFVMLPLYSIKDEVIQPEGSKWLIGLNKNGDEIWRKEEPREGWYPVPFQIAPNGQTITALSSSLEGLSYITSYNELGEIVWERKLVGSEISPVLIDADNHVYIAAGGKSGDRYLYAFFADGTTKWKIKLPTPLGSEVETMILGNDESIYFTLQGKNMIFKVTQAVP